jgi:hypothetical protein
MCIVPLIEPILRDNEHIRNFVKPCVWKCVSFSNAFYGWRYITFHLLPFKAEQLLLAMLMRKILQHVGQHMEYFAKFNCIKCWVQVVTIPTSLSAGVRFKTWTGDWLFRMRCLWFSSICLGKFWLQPLPSIHFPNHILQPSLQSTLYNIFLSKTLLNNIRTRITWINIVFLHCHVRPNIDCHFSALCKLEH